MKTNCYVSSFKNSFIGLFIAFNALFFTSAFGQAPLIFGHPSVSNPICNNNTVTLTAYAIGSSNLMVKWQRKGAADANYTDLNVFTLTASGFNTSYPFTAILADNGASYRAVFLDNTIEVPSNAAVVTMSTGVHIVDANFAAAIRTACPTCIDVCDNLTAAAANLTTLDVVGKNISDLTGLEGFTSLTILNCSTNQLTSLPTLPTTLQHLVCANNKITTLPTLPNGLIQLYIDYNLVATLPTLPSTLQTLYAGGNLLTTLPTLPTGLKYFSCWSNQITALPSNLPSGLIELGVYNTPLSILPNLPTTLQHLSCYGTNITCLPNLPIVLAQLLLDPAKISCLPNVPTNLSIYDKTSATDIRNSFGLCVTVVTPPSVSNPICAGNNVVFTTKATSSFAMTLRWQRKGATDAAYTNVTTATPYTSGTDATFTITPTIAADNQAQYRAVFATSCADIVSSAAQVVMSTGLHIPDANFATGIRAACPTCIDVCDNLTTAASTLLSLDVNSRNISDLTGLESFTSLQRFYGHNNKIATVPPLPNSLIYFICPNNKIAMLPTLPNNLLELFVDNNLLTNLPTLPSSLRVLYTGGNQLTSLPTLPTGLTNFSCWSNQITALPSNLPTGLTELGCHDNPLSILPTIPTTVTYLSCYLTNLYCLAILPNGLTTLRLDPTRITCLPNYPTNCAIYNGTSTTNIRNTFTACSPLTVTVHPSVTNPICNVPTVILSAAATNNSPMTVKWQRKGAADANFTDLNTPVAYTSGNTATYTISIAPTNEGAKFRAYFSSDCNGGAYTNDVTFSLSTGVHIPNANFAAAIRLNCPTCIDICDNLTPTAATLTTLNVSGKSISNLTGIEGFTNLTSLYCSENHLTVLPTLPNSITLLNISKNGLTTLPTLPSSLNVLYSYTNRLTSLPTLPSGLTWLECQDNQLTSLPALPNGIEELHAYNNLLPSLPTLPSNLTILKVSFNQLTSLPILPNFLYRLDCNDNKLTSLPTLPNSMGLLACFNNDIRCLPTLPSNLGSLKIDLTKIHCLPNKPVNLVVNSSDIGNFIPICGASSVIIHPSVSNPVCVDNVVTLTAQVVSNNSMTVKWQVKRAIDANYFDITAASEYTSGDLANDNIVVEAVSNGNSYRAVFSTCGSDVVTNPTTFTLSTGLHIPDMKFATAIRSACANCLDACDNLTTNAAALTTLNVSSSQISDLTGISGFTNLINLYCNYNPLTSLPSNLPSGLQTLSCTNTLIGTLPSTLPSGLTALYCGSSFLNTLPTTLPTNLRTLDCSNAYLTALPSTLPSGLLSLNCSSNQLTSLPNMPTTLLELNCSSNALTSLPAFYNKIQYLYCQNNQLTSLPASLPADLKYLRCQNNRLTDLPSSLTPSILEIECYDNNIYCLPTLPNALTNLKLDKLKIMCLSNMVAGLVIQNRDIAGDISNTYALCAAPSVVRHPSVSGSPRVGQTTSFIAKATNNNVTTIKWQRKGALGINFSDISGTETAYTTNTDATYNTPNLTNTDFGASYRAVFTSQCSGQTMTNAVTLNFAALPVELLSFIGQNTEGGNTLTWTTAIEENTSHFDIERSMDGHVFEKIGETKAKGSNTVYTFLDSKPFSGFNYYQLKINDLNGDKNFSKIISIEMKEPKTKVFKVYPNPATTDLTIEIPFDTEGVEVINTIGQVVFKEKIKEKDRLLLNISDWQSGIYFIKTTNSTALVKFIKN